MCRADRVIAEHADEDDEEDERKQQGEETRLLVPRESEQVVASLVEHET